VRTGGRIMVQQEISAIVLGTEVPLGKSRLELDAFRVASVEDVAGAPDHRDVILVPVDVSAGNVFERLVKPARRPPPPPPRKAKRKKRNKRR
jgi:hypothetical protein